MDLDVRELDFGMSASPVACGSHAFGLELASAVAVASTESAPAESEMSKKLNSCAPCRIRRVK